jgi:hypothetical protein
MVDFIFTLINLAILGVLCIYVFKRFFMPYVRDGVEQDNRYLQSLHQERQELIVTQEETSRSITEQEALCKTLKLRVDQWKGSIEAQKAEQETYGQAIDQARKQKLEKQSQSYALYNVSKQIRPHVLREVTHELETYFADERYGHGYIDTIISHLKKNII